jgi:WS/DGAT/MGAT family acyltransferase
VERRANGPVERLGAADLMYLALQGSTVPEQFGAVLVLQPGADFDVASAVAVLAERVRAVPRLRQRVRRVPPGCGRPVWVDDEGFDAERHLRHVACPAPGDERALLDVAGQLITTPLRVDRPLWGATVVTGLADGRAALVIVVQHALSDGVGGLALLRSLVDGAPPPVGPAVPVPPPSTAQLAREAARARLRALGALPAKLRSAVDRRPALQVTPPAGRARGAGRAGACSLLRPTGSRRRVTVARARLDTLRATAHAGGATVNDVLLTAVGGALGATLEERGEHPLDVVVSFPVSERPSTSADDLGNRIRVARAAIPGAGDRVERLARVAAVTRDRKRSAMGPVAGVVASDVVRVMFRLGLHDRYLRRQRYLHTVVTNVHGPDEPQTFCGAPVVEVIPLAVGGGGNVTVTFAALSYAGTLVVTVTADPDLMPDQSMTTRALQAELGPAPGT